MGIMAEYRATYKCRLCVETFTGAITEKEIAKTEAFMIACGYSGEYGTQRKMIHNCNDGNIGLADFLGFQKVCD